MPLSSAEAPDCADAQHIDLAVAHAADLVITLPLAAQAEGRHDVVLQTGAIGKAVTGFAGAVLHFAVVPAELAVDAEPVRHRKEANAHQFPGIRLGAAKIAQVVITHFGGKVGVELISAENTPGSVLVIAAAAILDLRLSDRTADVERARVHLRRRRKRA